MRILLTLEYDGTAYRRLAAAGERPRRAAGGGGGRVQTGGGKDGALWRQPHGRGRPRPRPARPLRHRQPHPPDKYAYALNTMLPRDIRVRESCAVPDNFHRSLLRRGQALPLPNLRRAPRGGAQPQYTRHVIYPLDAEKMRAELPALLGEHDLPLSPPAAAWSRTRCVRSPARTSRRRPEYALFLEGTGFLYNMVRIIAGTLIGVGTGKLEPGAFSRALISKSRLDLGVTAPAHALRSWRCFTNEGGRL